MSTSYKAQLDNLKGKYIIKFVTTNYDYFKFVENACQKAIDENDKVKKEMKDNEICYSKRNY